MDQKTAELIALRKLLAEGGSGTPAGAPDGGEAPWAADGGAATPRCVRAGRPPAFPLLLF